MTAIAALSRSELSQRRKQLRHQRRMRLCKSSWRFLSVAALAGGVIWGATQPAWVIRRSDQVKIEGNQFLSAQTVRSLLPIPYPQSVFRTQPQDIIATLKAKAPIADATVERQLFPPGITVKIRERNPVAIVLSQPGSAKPSADSKAESKAEGDESPDQAPSKAPSKAPSAPPFPDGQSLLDENGMTLSMKSYTSIKQNLELPKLRVIGNPDLYRQNWAGFYQALRRSPVKIEQIDWRNPGNLILQSDLGVVHLGLYSDRLPDQLKALDRMRQLPNRVSRDQIAYIDLSKPDAPAVQMKSGPAMVKPEMP
jgi:cell division protein FtsQ